jgi:hypothetical protein
MLIRIAVTSPHRSGAAGFFARTKIVGMTTHLFRPLPGAGSERGCLARLRGRNGRVGRFQRGRKGRGRAGRSADAGFRRKRRDRRGQSLVHDPPNGASTAPTFGTASQTPIDLARRSDGAFGRNGSDLMVRNDVARTHDHDGTPSAIRLCACARPSAFICMMTYPCHLAMMSSKHNEMKSL